MNFFALFDLPISLPIDEKLLETRYKMLQKHFHPDNFVQASAQEKRLALTKSADINRAFQTLKNPIESAKYLLSLQNINVFQEKSVFDPEILQKQFEFREKFADLRENYKKNPQIKNEIIEFQSKINQKFSECYQKLLQFLQNKNWEESVTVLNDLCFFDKLKREINTIFE